LSGSPDIRGARSGPRRTRRPRTTSTPPTSDQEYTVAANCDVCAKGPSFGHSVSHSHVKTNRRWNPNIQRVRVVENGTPKRLNVCTSCLKAGKVRRAV
jgi:large subunit ribosomal protein L28